MKRLVKLFKIILYSCLIVCGILFILFAKRDKSVEDLKAVYAKAPSKFISVEGINVHYRDEGNQKDTLPIVLIHGTGASLHTFDTWTKTLKQNRRVVRLDLPAFGLTGPFLDRNYSIKHYVDFIYQFLNKNQISKCVLAGNSLGGQIAWQFTATHSEMVEKLILIDAAGYPLESQGVPIAFKVAKVPVLNKLLTVLTPKFMVQSSVENVYFDKTKVTDALVDRYYNLTLREGNRQALVDRMTINQDTTPRQLIPQIEQPTLVLWGNDDLLIPLKSAYRFHEELPNDTLVILPNTGHVPMEESPNASLKVVLAFLKQ